MHWALDKVDSFIACSLNEKCEGAVESEGRRDRTWKKVMEMIKVSRKKVPVNTEAPA